MLAGMAAVAGAQDTGDSLITSDACTGPTGHRRFVNHHPLPRSPWGRHPDKWDFKRSSPQGVWR